MKKRNEIVKIVRLPFAKQIEAITGTNISNIFKRHIHKAYIIGKVTEGKRSVIHTEGSSEISMGEMFLINPGQVHTCRSAEDTKCHSYQILSVGVGQMQSIAKEISEKPENKPYFPQIHYQDKDISEKFENLFKLLEKCNSQLEIETEIILLLSSIIINFSKSPPEICPIGEQNISVTRVCKYIANNYSENLSLIKLSRIACLSPFHFQRVFTKIMGISAHDYQMHYRISEAKKMLLSSKEIADIAIETGFVDQSHFSRIFKKTIGIPPGKYKNINC
jgi:AraC-like DNA-binding protein